MSKWLATYLAPKIRVNTVSPGGIKKNKIKSLLKNIPTKHHLNECVNQRMY